MNNVLATHQKIWGILLWAFLIVNADKVCKISYHDYPANLDGITIEVPEDAVSLSEAITIKQPDDSSVTFLNTPAIMFVIDNSGSMFKPHQYDKNEKDSTYELARDPEGNRFTVTSALIDSLYEKDPNSQVGLTVFGSGLHYDSTGEVTKYIDPDDFSNMWNGTFVTFLQLNKEYENKGKMDSGFNILKFFLETHELTEDVTFTDANNNKIGDTTVTYTMLKNLRRTYKSYTGTDITLAFDAVKASLEFTEVDVKNQYTIFFSDGVPSGTSNDDFKEGKGVPTTYTVFFDPDMEAPAVLKEMNKNIQDNGYSSSNPKSELWPFDNSSHEELLEFMVENILNKISGEITTEPIEITINGKSNGVWEDDTFVFTEQFPLIGELSPFKFDISYLLKIKTSDGKEEVDSINEEVDFSVERMTNPDLLDSLEVEYWNRDILFYEDGEEISALNEKSEEFELRFREEHIDCNYRYSDVDIILRSEIMGDELTVRLDEKDEHNFRKIVAVDFKANSPDNSDDVLQISPNDRIIAFFANPRLPLDTLTEVLATDISNSLRFSSAVYFDMDANGSVDKIECKYSSLLPISDDLKEKIEEQFELPSFRKFSIDSTEIKNSTFTLFVEEQRDEIQTFTSDEDVIKVSEKDLDSIIIDKVTLEIIDSVAPVLADKEVLVEKRLDGDVLTVTFSEELEDISSESPLYFYNEDGDRYQCILEVDETKNGRYVFNVTDGIENISNGDSVHINFSENIIGDNLNNWQRNSKNIKRLIKVREQFRFTEATYYDKDADGHPDILEVLWESGSGSLDIDTDKLVALLSLPEFRDLKIDKEEVELTDRKLNIPVEERMEDINTAVTLDDVLKVKSGTEGIWYIHSTEIDIVDSMAPVIKSNPVLYVNSMEDDGADSLSLFFSEEIEDIDSDTPLRFFHEKNDLVGELSVLTHDGAYVTFEVLSLEEDVSELIAGDSVNINKGVADNNGKEQKNRKNIRRPIDVRLILPKIDVDLIAVNPYKIKETVVHDDVIAAIDDVEKYALEMSDSGFVGCLLMTEFKPRSLLKQLDIEIEGTISILDKVGNVLVESAPMEYVSDFNELLYIWNGKNTLKRIVGGDSFVAVANIRLTINRNRSYEYREEVIISTKNSEEEK